MTSNQNKSKNIAKVFLPPFPVGSVVSNSAIVDTFKVGNMGGMRRSNVTNTLVIISDHTKGLYDDKWYGNILHYTGMGKKGDQVLTGNQNRTLAESNTNGVIVHLFEVLIKSKYIYQGIVTLCGAPYQEDQLDEDGHNRKVWMFPLSTTKSDVSVSEDAFNTYMSKLEKDAKHLSCKALEDKAKERSSDTAAHRAVTTTTYIRDPYVAEYSKARANGICQLCGNPAPFCDKDGKPYLESHHIIWLKDGGADSIENTVALCPNCHRKMHIVNSAEDKEILIKKASK